MSSIRIFLLYEYPFLSSRFFMEPDTPKTENNKGKGLKAEKDRRATGLIALWFELKRRRVMHVVGIYGGVGWVVMQVGATVFPNLGFPQWILSALIILITLGFPVAMVVAWIYDLTPQGIQTTDTFEEHPEVESQKYKRKPQHSLPLLLAATALPTVLFGALAIVFFFQARSATDELKSVTSDVKAKEKSIAVLPFVNRSSDKENEYLSDGLTEELLNALARVPGLRVPARTSSFVFKGKTDDIKKIGELLNVGHLVEGSVQKSGNQLRVNSQLINVADGFQLWSGKYDREMTNIFEIQDDIAQTIVDKLELTLMGSKGLPKSDRHTQNVEAYELTGFALFAKGEHEAGIKAAEKAIQLAEFPLVLGKLGWMYGRVGRDVEAQEVLDRLLARAEKQYIPALCMVYVYDGLEDYDQANEWMNKAIADRESSLVFFNFVADDITRASPYYSEWMDKIGLDEL